MKHILAILFIISFIGCSDRQEQEVEVANIYINRAYKIGIVKLKNNTDKNKGSR